MLLCFSDSCLVVLIVGVLDMLFIYNIWGFGGNNVFMNFFLMFLSF